LTKKPKFDEGRDRRRCVVSTWEWEKERERERERKREKERETMMMILDGLLAAIDLHFFTSLLLFLLPSSIYLVDPHLIIIVAPQKEWKWCLQSHE
jgi:hypothetical protein